MNDYESKKAEQSTTTEPKEKDRVDVAMDYDQIEGAPFVY